jgi:membrane associated rhomboid family serine protease
MIPVKDNIPLLRFPLITVALALVEIAGYLLSLRHGGSFFGGPSERTAVQHGAIPFELSHSSGRCGLLTRFNGVHVPRDLFCGSGRAGAVMRHSQPGQPATWQTVFSALALHGSFVSLLADAIALAIFGPTVEDALGRLRFLLLFLLGGVFTLAVQLALAPNSTFPAFLASGSVAVVLGAYLRLYPRARVISLALIPMLATIVEVPAVLLLALWLLVQLWFGIAGVSGPGEGWLGISGSGADFSPLVHGGWIIAYAAALAGFLAGALLAPLIASDERRSAKALPTPVRPVY